MAVVLVKPDGKRFLVNYSGRMLPLPAGGQCGLLRCTAPGVCFSTGTSRTFHAS